MNFDGLLGTLMEFLGTLKNIDGLFGNFNED
jgi:hypothetical protein